MPPHNYCTKCGACCAYYRISFDYSEVANRVGGIIPSHLTVRITQSKSAMKGTLKHPIRCEALQGEIAHSVCCSIYDRRPSTCRNFLSLWEHNVTNSHCDRARAAYGLVPLSIF